MTVSSDQHREGMRQLAAAVSIIACASNGVRNGLTATAVMSLSVDPPSLSIAINKSASALPLLLQSGAFSVNVLCYEQTHIARKFASSTIRGEDRFDGATWMELETGSPILTTAAAAFDCCIDQTIEYGTHLLLIGSIKAIHVNPDEKPLLYVDGSWSGLVKSTSPEVENYKTIVDRHVDAVNRALSAQASASERLRCFIKDFALANIEETKITKGFMNYEPYMEPDKLTEISKAKEILDTKLKRLIEEGVESGEFHTQDAKLTALAITGMITWTYRWFQPEGRFTPEEISTGLSEMVLNMVTAPAIPNANKSKATQF